ESLIPPIETPRSARLAVCFTTLPTNQDDILTAGQRNDGCPWLAIEEVAQRGVPRLAAMNGDDVDAEIQQQLRGLGIGQRVECRHPIHEALRHAAAEAV